MEWIQIHHYWRKRWIVDTILAQQDGREQCKFSRWFLKHVMLIARSEADGCWIISKLLSLLLSVVISSTQAQNIMGIIWKLHIAWGRRLRISGGCGTYSNAFLEVKKFKDYPKFKNLQGEKLAPLSKIPGQLGLVEWVEHPLLKL